MTEHVKRSVRDGWDAMSSAYQRDSSISADDVHYGPFCPGERDLGLIGDVGGKRVLELACGAAQNSVALAKWGANVVAIDISANQLAEANRIVSCENVKVDLIQGDIERLGMFADNTFDLIVSSFGLEFVPDLQMCFRECARVIRQGGRLVACTTHPLAAFEWDDLQKALLVDNYFAPPVEIWNESGKPGNNAITHFRTFSDMFSMLTEAGFQVDQVVEPYPLPPSDALGDDASTTPYGGRYWNDHYERLTRVPFSIVYVAHVKW